MSKRYHELLASSQGRRFRSEAEMSAYLDAEQITDPTDRIAFKLSMQAAGELGTDATVAMGSLATDRPVSYASPVEPLSKEMATWMRRAGLDPAGAYSNDDVTTAFLGSGLSIEEKIAVRHHLASTGRLRAGASTIQPTPRPGMSATRDLSAASAPRRVLRDPQTGQVATLKGYSF